MSFYVTIKNSQGQEIRVKVSLEIYELFEAERKEQERIRKEQERHGSDEDVEGDIADTIIAGVHSLLMSRLFKGRSLEQLCRLLKAARLPSKEDFT